MPRIGSMTDLPRSDADLAARRGAAAEKVAEFGRAIRRMGQTIEQYRVAAGQNDEKRDEILAAIKLLDETIFRVMKKTQKGKK